MDTFSKIKDELNKYSEIKYEVKNDTLTIFPKRKIGFTISINSDGDFFTVCFEGWHETFESADDVLDCVLFGLSENCRLLIISYGRKPCKWIVEYKDNEKWKVRSSTGLVFFPFWKKKVTMTLQNDTITK